MASVSGLSFENRIIARDRAVQAALLGLKRKSSLHYTQGRKRWQGISSRDNAKLGECPEFADCSSFATWCLWNGLYIPFKVRDTVNGAGWKHGFTGTMRRNGKRVMHLQNVMRGDCVIYGRGGDGSHTAIAVGRRKRDDKIMVISFGSEAGPFYLPYDYRSDIMEIRRYI